MQSSRKIRQVLLGLGAFLAMGMTVMAADPGLSFPAAAEVSDQKAGSVLVYNLYSSIPATPNRQNTRFSITNTNSVSPASVHLFFVEGSSCGVSDRYICLTENQTLSFLASEQDPGTTGYLVAIAVDFRFGCPFAFNYLIGDALVKLEAGHQANLGAEAISALYNGFLPGCDPNSVAAVIPFNGVALAGYNSLPRILAVSSIFSQADGNDTRVVINQIRGSLVAGSSAAIGVLLFGILYDDQERAQSWNSSLGCQRFTRLTDDFPRTTPRFNVVIPSGQSGWMKFWATVDVGILGSVLNFNPNAGASGSLFNGGRNLHKLTLSNFNAYTIPVFPPNCSFGRGDIGGGGGL